MSLSKNYSDANANAPKASIVDAINTVNGTNAKGSIADVISEIGAPSSGGITSAKIELLLPEFYHDGDRFSVFGIYVPQNVDFRKALLVLVSEEESIYDNAIHDYEYIIPHKVIYEESADGSEHLSQIIWFMNDDSSWGFLPIDAYSDSGMVTRLISQLSITEEDLRSRYNMLSFVLISGR